MTHEADFKENKKGKKVKKHTHNILKDGQLDENVHRSRKHIDPYVTYEGKRLKPRS